MYPNVSMVETPPRSVRSLGRVPQQKVTHIKEQYVLKMGLLCLHKRLMPEVGATFEAAHGSDNKPRFRRSESAMQASSLLGRLLSGAVELKVCAKGDVCAAQPDLRTLSVHQLLKLRADTLDFDTESDSFTAHRNFINTIELHLFEKVAKLFLRSAPEQVILQSSWHAFGVQVMLVIGVAEELQKRSIPPLHPVWVFRLEEQDWPLCKLAMLNVDDLWTSLVYEGQDQLTRELAPEENVTVIRDRSSGPHRNRMLDLDILTMPAHLGDLQEELAMSKSKLLERHMTQELNNVLAHRLSKLSAPDDKPVVERQLGDSQASIASSDIPVGTVAERANAINMKFGARSLPRNWKRSQAPPSPERTEEIIVIGDQAPMPTTSTVAAVDLNASYDDEPFNGDEPFEGDEKAELVTDPLLKTPRDPEPEPPEQSWLACFGCCFVRDQGPEHPTLSY